MVTSQQELNFSRPFFDNDMKFEIVPNFIDLFGVKPLSDFMIDNKKGILYLGRIHPKKGIERLIEAYKNLDDELVKDNPLLIVGDGNKDYINRLKNISKFYKKSTHNIFFLGHKEGLEKELLYKKSKDINLINMILFAADFYFYNLLKNKSGNMQKIIENKSYVINNLNKFISFNLNQNSLINAINNKLSNE